MTIWVGLELAAIREVFLCRENILKSEKTQQAGVCVGEGRVIGGNVGHWFLKDLGVQAEEVVNNREPQMF